MPNFSPLSLSIMIAGIVAIAGILIAARQRFATFAGYEAIMQDVRRLRRRLRGELERDGDDVIVRGQVRNWPVLVRFSHGEHTPGLQIRMELPATFSLFMSAPNAAGAQGRFPVRLRDSVLDARFAVRSDHPTEVRLFAASGNTRALLRLLGRSARTCLSITPGVVELTEPTIPQPFASRVVLGHLRTMAQLALAMRAMPGAHRITVRHLRRSYSVAARAAMLVGLVTAVATVVSAGHDNDWHAVRTVQVNEPPAGVTPVDALLISGVRNWRVAAAADFDPAVVDWLAQNRQKPLGRFDGGFAGSVDDGAAAYILTRDDRTFRIVMLARGQVKYDATYASLGGVARLPRRDFSRIEWQGPVDANPDGDGLVLVLRSNDRSSGVVLFSRAGTIISAAPVDYQTLDLK